MEKVVDGMQSINMTLESTQHHLLGLSPHFWTYVPMLNQDIHALEVINGVNCYVGYAHDLPPIVDKTKTDTESFAVPHTTKEEDWKQPKTTQPQPKQYDEYRSKNNTNHHSNESSPSLSPQKVIVPVTRCELVGVVVTITHRSNGAILMIVDDGTGFIDCLTWEDDCENPHSNYYLPSIPVPSTSMTPLGEPIWVTPYSPKKKQIQLGDLLKIRGKLKCLDLDPLRQHHHHHYVREIHVTTYEKIHHRWEWDAEAVHWLEAIQFRKRILMGLPSQESVSLHNAADSMEHPDNDINMEDDHDDSVRPLTKIPTGADMVALMGPRIQSMIANGDFLRTTHPSSLSYCHRVSPSSCPCHHLEYQDQLLYCHCVATPEPMDPTFEFRDALLQYLVRLEETSWKEHPHDTHLNNPPSQNTPSKKRRRLSHPNAPRSVQMQPFYFLYSHILQNEHLLNVAMDMITNKFSKTHNHPDNHIPNSSSEKDDENDNEKEEISLSKSFLNTQRRRLYMNTFRILRKDGILHLLDVEKDEYVLLSRKGLLDGYVKDYMMGRPITTNVIANTKTPDFLNHVPKSKLQCIRKKLSSLT